MIEKIQTRLPCTMRTGGLVTTIMMDLLTLQLEASVPMMLRLIKHKTGAVE